MMKDPFLLLPNGIIEFRGENFRETYYPWDQPGGFRVEGAERSRGGYLSPLAITQVIEGTPPFDRIHESIPREVLAEVMKNGYGRYGLLRLCALRQEPAMRLMRQNPLLALALSREHEEVASELVTKPWREIVGRCRIPGGSSIARIMARMSSDLLHHLTLRELMRLGERKRQMLSYIARVTVDVWACVTSLPDKALSVPLLKMASLQERGTLCRDRVRDVLRVRQALGLEPVWPFASTISKTTLRHISDRVVEWRRSAFRSGAIPTEQFPPPPFPPCEGYIPVLDTEDLSYVALRFACCAESYYEAIMDRSVSIWWNEGTEPHVVLLTDQGDAWWVDQVISEGNLPVSHETYDRANQFFHGRRTA